MPKVSASHQEQQATRILAAARTCFAHHGLQATSMDEIIAEVGMSSSTVYRYFPNGKRALIEAVVEGWFRSLTNWLDSIRAQEPRSLEDLLTQGIHHVLATKNMDGEEPQGSTGLVMDIWGICARDPELRRLSATHHRHVREGVRTAVERLQQAGRVTARIASTEAAVIIHQVTLGLISEHAVTGEADIARTIRALTRILIPAPGEASSPGPATS